jgi:trimeric autotransporter adhesin
MSVGSWGWGGPITQLNFDSWTHKDEHQNNHDIVGNITKAAGRWTFKAGGEYRVYLSNWQDLEQSTPMLNTADVGNASTAQYANINGTGSSLNIDPAQKGLPFVDLLTGVAGFQLDPGCGTILALAAKYFALYSQNDWKVTNKLTLNLGLRWEVQPGPTERFNRLANIDLNAPNPYTAGANLSNPQGGLGLVGFAATNGLPRNMWNTQWGNFSPRLGAAYQITNDTVLRGGYGRSYYNSNSGFNANGLIYGQVPFSAGAEALPYGLTPNGVPVGTFDQAPNTLVFGGLGAVQAPYIYGNAQGGCCGWFPQNHPNSYVDQWNFFVEHSFGRDWKLSAGYVGSHASNLIWRGFDLNGTYQVPNSTLMGYRAGWIASNGAQDPAQAQVPNPLPAMIGKASGPIGLTTIPTIDAQLPWLALLGDTIIGAGGYTDYNALQVSIQHPFSNGLTLLANYTWSKATGLTGGPGGTSFSESELSDYGGVSQSLGGVDYANMNNNRGLQSYDIPHRLVVATVYTLPFNKGQKLAPGNSFVRALASGWQLAPVVTLQSGQPWGPNCGGMSGRCNIVPGEPIFVPKNLQHWYDGTTSVTLPDGRSITPAAFTYLKYNPDRYTAPIVKFPNGTYAVDQYWTGQTAMYQPGLRSPLYANVDLSIQREIPIRERLRLMVSAAATNAFNRTSFYPGAINGGGGAVTDSTSSALGLNSNISTGSLNPQFYNPRIITFSVYLKF